MERVERTIEVDVPVSTAYNQWTQFETFPEFMGGVESVRQIDDATVHWIARIAGTRREWDARITEQEPDRVIAWQGFGDPRNMGRVLFEPVGDDGTKISVAIDYEPADAVEKAGDALGIVGRRVEGDLERFKAFIEARGTETGAWRGEIRGGEPTELGTASDADERPRQMPPTGTEGGHNPYGA
jgi:uncharacterized membrane protein